jgi:hypothetical protein
MSLSLFSQPFEIDISLSSHKDSSYGTWKLHKVKASDLSKYYYSKIIKGQRAAPFWIENTGIEIFNKELYQNQFLKYEYYKLDWIPKKGNLAPIFNLSKRTKKFLKESIFFQNYHAQDGKEWIDWSMVLADYRNSTIATIPSYNIKIQNLGKKSIHIISFYSKTVFTTGGEASPGGAYFPTESKVNYLSLTWDKSNSLKLEKPMTIKSHESKSIPLALFIKKGAQGDGPGRLIFALYIKYKEGDKIKESLLGIINQSEDYGYDTGWW